MPQSFGTASAALSRLASRATAATALAASREFVGDSMRKWGDALTAAAKGQSFPPRTI